MNAKRTIRTGRFVGLVCLGLALLLLPVHYWDLQNGDFSPRLAWVVSGLPVIGSLFMVLPGQGLAHELLPLSADRGNLARWFSAQAPSIRYAWLLGIAASFYMGTCYSSFLEGEAVFAWGTQLKAIVVGPLALLLLLFFVRLRR